MQEMPTLEDWSKRRTIKEEGGLGPMLDEYVTDVEKGIDRLGKTPEEIAHDERQAELLERKEERERVEIASAIEHRFGLEFVRELLKLKNQPGNEGKKEQTLYMQAVEVAYPFAHAEAKQKKPDLSDQLIADEILKSYMNILVDLGKRPPGEQISPEELRIMHIIMKRHGWLPESPSQTDASETPVNLELQSTGGVSTVSPLEFEQARGSIPEDVPRPAIFSLKDFQQPVPAKPIPDSIPPVSGESIPGPREELASISEEEFDREVADMLASLEPTAPNQQNQEDRRAAG